MIISAEIFKTSPVAGLPLPRWIIVVMILTFSLPLLVIPMTLSEVANNFWLLLLWPVACFPLALLYFLKRMFTRFEISLRDDHSVLITQPFSQHLIPATQLQSVIAVTQQAHVGGMARTRIPWLFFYDNRDQQITKVSPSAFSESDISGFLAAIAMHCPAVKIDRRS